MSLNPKNASPELLVRLGSDAKFPIKGSFEAVNGVDLVIQDVEQLLLTIPGERINRPTYGCNLRNQIWENLGDAATNGAAAIREAIDNFEPRINLTGVTSTVNENTGLITFNIQFVILQIDAPVNLVFPFRAGTQLSFQ